MKGRVAGLGMLAFSLWCGAEGLVLRDPGGRWAATVEDRRGRLVMMETNTPTGPSRVTFRQDGKGGPAWEGVELGPVAGRPFTFEGTRDGIRYGLAYRAEGGRLCIAASLKNESGRLFAPHRARLVLGVDTQMERFPQWDRVYFPTLLRCERTHFWGYLMSPTGRVLALGSPDPVASYGHNYVHEEKLEWTWGHQILTTSVDPLHAGPLPDRHPADATALAPGASRTWRFFLGEVPSLEDVKPSLATWLQAPMIEADRFVLAEGEATALRIWGPGPLKVQVLTPGGQPLRLPVEAIDGGARSRFQPAAGPGVYTLRVKGRGGRVAEAKLTVRRPWAWYLAQARRNLLTQVPRASGSCEAYYGYYTAFLARRHLPDAALDAPLEARFWRTMPAAFDLEQGRPREGDAYPWRIQNSATFMGILVDAFEATGDRRALEIASRLGDFLASPAVQGADGAYRSRKTHYTCVIYPAKSMLELAAAEATLGATDPAWRLRSERHHQSAKKAIDDLLVRRDDLETEGDQTFEDGMISCAATQLGLFATLQREPGVARTYADAARYMLDKHRCLEQRLIPDSRMRGATLRWWEALDVWFVPNQVMNSPHGWTAWKIYATWYLYLLTGEEAYLRDTMDTLGACVQVVDEAGTLRWGFLPDPYVRAREWMPDPAKPGQGREVDKVVGEQYLPMIGGWFLPVDDTKLSTHGEPGGTGDQTVHEIFKALAEVALTQAYVVQRADGSLATWNCRAERRGGVLHITPGERLVDRVHLNLRTPAKVRIAFASGVRGAGVGTGMSWLEAGIVR